SATYTRSLHVALPIFLGKYAVGRIARGRVQKNQPVALMKHDGTTVHAKLDRIFSYRGLDKEEIDSAVAGDIVAVTGIADAHIGRSEEHTSELQSRENL